MLKQIAWNTFKNTGNINTMMELIKTDEELKRQQLIINTANEKNINNQNINIKL